MANIKKLKDNNGTTIYPMTDSSAVYHNGKILNYLLEHQEKDILSEALEGTNITFIGPDNITLPWGIQYYSISRDMVPFKSINGPQGIIYYDNTDTAYLVENPIWDQQSILDYANDEYQECFVTRKNLQTGEVTVSEQAYNVANVSSRGDLGVIQAENSGLTSIPIRNITWN